MNEVRSTRVAYAAPFLVFLAFIFFGEAVKKLGEGRSAWWLRDPQYWIFPVQTLVCAAMLWKMRGRVALRPLAGFGFATLAAVLSVVLWITPQAFLGFPPRIDGFRPDFFGGEGWPYWINLVARILRMTVVVAFVEELFWRGFLLRWLVNENFASVPFGTFTWRSFLIGSFAFCLEHQPADWPAAVITGALFNAVACRTRSLAACVFAHALTNLLLAIYILRTGQWGFW